MGWGQGSRAQILAVVVLAVVFGSGVLFGLAWDRSLGAAPPEESVAEATEETESDERPPMYEQVDPTPEQKILIDSIVKDYRKAMEVLHEEFREAYEPRYRALIVETREAIKGVFTPEQAMAYDSILAEFDRKRREKSERDDDGDGD